jgi:serine/threonine protein phosphatase 1
VLKTRAWLDLPWEKLDAEAARFAHVPWTARLLAWAAELRALVPVLCEAAARSATFRGSPERMCRTPRRTLDIAAALGVPVPGRPF